MKILQVTISLNTGGAEKLVVELSNEQSRTEEVVVCSLRKIEEHMYLAKRLSTAVRLITLNAQQNWSIKILIDFLKILQQEKPHVVHVHGLLAFLYLFPISFLFKNIKFVYTIHTELVPCIKRIFNLINKISISKNFIYVCLSDNIRRDFSRHFPRLSFEYYVENGMLPMSITQDFEKVCSECNNLKIDKKTKLCLEIGNYSPYKNFPVLVNVFKHLEGKKYNVVLLIIGKDDSLYQHSLQEVKYIKGNNTFLLGHKSDVVDYLKNVDCLVLSSKVEGVPYVIIEAFSVGLPVITMPAGGVVDMVEESINGFISEDFTEESFYNAIMRFLKADEKLIEKIRENNIKKFQEKYSISFCKAKYDIIYRS